MGSSWSKSIIIELVKFALFTENCEFNQLYKHFNGNYQQIRNTGHNYFIFLTTGVKRKGSMKSWSTQQKSGKKINQKQNKQAKTKIRYQS